MFYIFSYKDDAKGSEIILMPADEYQITTMVDFGTKILGTQNASINHISEFKEEIAAARTFSFLHEIEMLLDNCMKNILCQARSSGEAWVQRKACTQVFLHDGFSSDFEIFAVRARFGRLRGSQIRKIGCCRTSACRAEKRAAH